jgi:hypothetical protein
MWENDLPMGDGAGTFRDGCSYEGTFKNGLPSGNGCLTYGGGIIRGVFEAGVIAQGEEVTQFGETYQGKFELPSQQKVAKRGVRTGDAINVLPDGSIYEGGFKGGRRNGFGKFTDGKTATQYQGKWVGGMRNGNGAETTASGHKFVGQWLDDIKEGQGQLVTKEGDVLKGAWRKGEYVGEEEKKE